MSESIKYSVIIPVFNAEQTIGRCLSSLVMEKRNDIEIIVINDGSTDNSLNIIQKFEEQNECIICLDQMNGGTSKARNAGLEYASGRYVTFVDSDDFVMEDYFSVLDRMDPDADICYFQKMTLGGNKQQETKLFQKINSCSTWIEKMKILLSSRIIMNPVNKRLKLQIIRDKGLYFLESLHISEDFNFCMEYSVHCSTIQVYSSCIYCVDLNNENSLSRKARMNLTSDINDAFHNVAETVQGSNLNKTEKQQLMVALDYLYTKNVCTCIAETFKYCPPRYYKNRAEYQKICKVFQTSLVIGVMYYNVVHHALRVFLQHNFIFPLYIVTWILKERKFRKYRKKKFYK